MGYHWFKQNSPPFYTITAKEMDYLVVPGVGIRNTTADSVMLSGRVILQYSQIVRPK